MTTTTKPAIWTPGDCCGSYFPEFHEVGLRMIKAQGGIFGWVSDSTRVIRALA